MAALLESFLRNQRCSVWALRPGAWWELPSSQLVAASLDHDGDPAVGAAIVLASLPETKCLAQQAVGLLSASILVHNALLAKHMACYSALRSVADELDEAAASYSLYFFQSNLKHVRNSSDYSQGSRMRFGPPTGIFTAFCRCGAGSGMSAAMLLQISGTACSTPRQPWASW